jgi:hypothetical protein
VTKNKLAYSMLAKFSTYNNVVAAGSGGGGG